MTANAVANYLKKKILLVTISQVLEKDLTKVRMIHSHDCVIVATIFRS